MVFSKRIRYKIQKGIIYLRRIVYELFFQFFDFSRYFPNFSVFYFSIYRFFSPFFNFSTFPFIFDFYAIFRFFFDFSIFFRFFHQCVRVKYLSDSGWNILVENTWDSRFLGLGFALPYSRLFGAWICNWSNVFRKNWCPGRDGDVQNNVKSFPMKHCDYREFINAHKTQVTRRFRLGNANPLCDDIFYS